MLRTWGRCSIKYWAGWKLLNTAETYKRRTGADTIMTQIKADIEQSLSLFGSANTPSSGKRVYWSRIAFYFGKEMFILWSGTHMGGGNTDFTTAKNALT